MSFLVPQGLSLLWLKTGTGRERENLPFFLLLFREKKKTLNKSMNSSPASGMNQKHQRLAINECPLLQLEQKCHITENT